MEKPSFIWKNLSSEIRIDSIYSDVASLFYGDDMKKLKRKQPKLTKREKQLLADIEKSREYYMGRENTNIQTIREKNDEIARLKDRVSELTADKRFLQQLVQNFSSAVRS